MEKSAQSSAIHLSFFVAAIVEIFNRTIETRIKRKKKTKNREKKTER